MTKKVIVFFSDENYFFHTLQAIISIKIFWNYRGDICVLVYELSDFKVKRLEKIGVEVIFRQREIPQNDCKYLDCILLRLSIFTLEFKKWDKILCLDSDISVRCDLNPLFENKGFSVAPDYWFSRISCQFLYPESPRDLILWKEIKETYDINKIAFNAGVMLIDTDIVTPNMYTEIRDLYYKYANISLFWDQSVLNLYFSHRCNILPQYYNNYIWVYSQHYPEIFNKIEDHYGIFHFIWKQKLFLKESPYFDYYQNILNQNLDNIEGIHHKYKNTKTLNQYKEIFIKINQDIFDSSIGFEEREGVYFIKNPENILIYQQG